LVARDARDDTPPERGSDAFRATLAWHPKTVLPRSASVECCAEGGSITGADQRAQAERSLLPSSDRSLHGAATTGVSMIFAVVVFMHHAVPIEMARSRRTFASMAECRAFLDAEAPLLSLIAALMAVETGRSVTVSASCFAGHEA
jgi:hypothetical protein